MMMNEVEGEERRRGGDNDDDDDDNGDDDDDDEQSGGRGAEGGGEEEIGSTVKIVPQARGSREELMDTEYQGIFSKTQN